MKNDIVELKNRLIELSHISSALALLEWDIEVHMPKKGSALRSETVSSLSGLLHDKLLKIDSDKILTNLKKKLDAKKLSPREAVIVAETWRTYDRERKIPVSLVKELSKVTSEAHHAWKEAREKNDFNKFKPYLEKIVELKRKEAKFVGYKNSPYDALIDTYEPGMTSDEASMILNDLKDFLIPFVKKIRQAKYKSEYQKIKGQFPIDKQKVFNQIVAGKIGFDFEAGLMAESAHPFTTGFHPQDVRFTTRYKKDDVWYSVSSIIHEVGHALYEQGILAEHFGTPLGESISLGIHESQARMWENIIGKGYNFWKYFYPKLQKDFPKPFKKVPITQFYRIINEVSPSLIRTEADEVTYSLHIIIRFEIEKELIAGSINVKDLPAVWNDKVKSYLGISVPNDSLGVLQDVHWSGGAFGYFPCYVFGNLYGAQFFKTAKKQIRNLDLKISKGDFKDFGNWLKKNIFIHGKFYSAGGLIREVTGEELTSKYFIDYLKEKYSKLYNL